MAKNANILIDGKTIQLAGVPTGVVLMDTSYGNNSQLRHDFTGLGLSYVAAIQSTTKVRPVRKGDPKPRRLSVEALALKLPKHAWRTITWREGTNKSLQSRFARVRVRVAPQKGEARFAEETMLIEWSKGEAAPTKFWLATVDRTMSFRGLVDLAKLRWRIERDYHDLKASGITRAAAGRASIITAHYPSQPTAF